MNFKSLALILPIALAVSLPKQDNPRLVAREPSPKYIWWDDVNDFFEKLSGPDP
ncbi:hypothetical protein DSO57_1012219 [Entomophthora muscae]|uniref:Uncharacterized protein n=2 Tax=Entomophthora muscae TaxID=34485 RepID=A0ACC2URR1_9FUNG|nr:hypothetical protein DSO57_1033729 [Entomophthora muscae]KAJ9089518.1 hypothetical protein DSO57_1012219 [Entomophthora muscae]